MIQVVGMSSKPQQFMAKLVPFCLGSLRDTYPFLLTSSTSIYLLSQNTLER